MSTNLATTRLSSKGQVVIPEGIRDSLGLKTGVQFVVIGKGDSVIFKTISPPSFDEFEDLLLRFYVIDLHFLFLVRDAAARLFHYLPYFIGN